MNKADKKLASRLLYLPIDLGKKIFLWLTYRGLKPVSEITIIRRNLRFLRQGIKTPFDLHGPQAKRIDQKNSPFWPNGMKNTN